MIVPARTQEDRATLVAYLASKIGTSPADLVGQMPFEVVATTRAGKPVGAVLYINYRGSSVEMACAGEDGWLTPGHLRGLFGFPFQQMGVWTVLTMVKRTNKTAREFNRRLGFTELCVIPGETKDEDAFLHSMTRPQCRWIETAAVTPRPPAAYSNGAHVHG